MNDPKVAAAIIHTCPKCNGQIRKAQLADDVIKGEILNQDFIMVLADKYAMAFRQLDGLESLGPESPPVIARAELRQAAVTLTEERRKLAKHCVVVIHEAALQTDVVWCTVCQAKTASIKVKLVHRTDCLVKYVEDV